MTRWLTAVAAAVIAVAALTAVQLIGPMPASAASCRPASVGGRSVGTIKVGRTVVPIKPVSFPPGGVLEPPPSNRVAGISRQHAGLQAQRGTTVLTWHVLFGKGCRGSLNRLLAMPIGSTFTVKPSKGRAQAYRIVKRLRVPKGRYRVEWFRQDGPHRLALFTCAGLRDGVFHDTVAVFAKPVAGGPAGSTSEYRR